MDNPPEQLVNELHRKYYEQLVQLFDEHKHRCGYGHSNIVLKDS